MSSFPKTDEEIANFIKTKFLKSVQDGEIGPISYFTSVGRIVSDFARSKKAIMNSIAEFGCFYVHLGALKTDVINLALGTSYLSIVPVGWLSQNGKDGVIFVLLVDDKNPTNNTLMFLTFDELKKNPHLYFNVSVRGKDSNVLCKAFEVSDEFKKAVALIEKMNIDSSQGGFHA